MDDLTKHLDELSFLAENKYAKVSNILAVVMPLLTVIHFLVPDLDEALALIPHHTVIPPMVQCPFPFFWNIVTAHLFEREWFMAILVVPCIVLLARRLEELWSTKAMVLHLLFTMTATGLTIFVLQLIRVFRTHREKDFFEPVHGCCGLLVTLAIGLRHAFPFEALPLVPKQLGVQYQHLPFALTVSIMLVGVLEPKHIPEWPFAPWAFFYGWLNIRYFMWFSYAEAYGDHAPEFSFAVLFPPTLRSLVSHVGAAIHKGTSCFCPLSLRENTNDLGQAILYDPTTSTEMERHSDGSATSPASEYELRRAKALALLDENIASLLSDGSMKQSECESELSFEARAEKGLATLELMQRQSEAA